MVRTSQTLSPPEESFINEHPTPSDNKQEDPDFSPDMDERQNSTPVKKSKGVKKKARDASHESENDLFSDDNTSEISPWGGVSGIDRAEASTSNITTGSGDSTSSSSDIVQMHQELLLLIKSSEQKRDQREKELFTASELYC